MELLKVVFLLLLAAVSSHSQSFHFFSCPKPTVQENFNVREYLGTWYEIEKLPAVFERGKCVQAKYSLRPDGTVHVHNAELLSDGKINSIEGVAKIERPAVFSVSFFSAFPDAPYMVLSTDYRSYALVYSCSNYFGLFNIDFAWVLSRHRELNNATISQLHEKLTAIGVDTTRLSVTDQTGCSAMDSV